MHKTFFEIVFVHGIFPRHKNIKTSLKHFFAVFAEYLQAVAAAAAAAAINSPLLHLHNLPLQFNYR